MKKSLFLAVVGMMVFAGAQAFASVGPQSSWDEIYQAGLWPNFPKVWFGNVDVPVISICVDGDMLRAGTAERCVEYTGGRNERCTKTETYNLVTPRVHQWSVCSHYRNHDSDTCEEYQTGTAATPLSYDVDVVQHYGRDQNERLMFVKHFDIPACNQ